MKNTIALLAAALLTTLSFTANASQLLPEELGQSLLATAASNIESGSSPLSLSHSQALTIMPLSSGITGDSIAGRPPQDEGRIQGPRKYIELSPFVGYTFGGRLEDEETDEKVKIKDASSYGVRVAWDHQRYSQIEFLWSHQETELSDNGPLPEDTMFDLDVDYFHIGGTIVWNQGKVEPFFSGSLGLARFDPEDSGLDTETRFSLGFGGGVRYFPTKRLGMVLGARGFVTFFNSEWEVTSDSEGTTARYEADALWQFQVYSGLVLVF
jgi:hypothetical protein